MLKIKDLLPDEANFNTGTEFGNSLIDKSLSKFGAGRSILIDKNNRIIAGNKTIENAAANGFDDVVIVETTGEQIVAVKRTDIDLNTKKGREMALADNATAKANISWDAQTLTEWDMPLQEWGIDLTDITEVEPAGESDAEPQIDKAAELNKKWGVVSGDLWQIGEHRLLCGDSTKREDVERLMDGQKAQGSFTSPPYAEQRKEQYGGTPVEEYVEWWQSIQGNVQNILSDTGSFFVNIKPHCEEGERSCYVMDLVLSMKRRWGWRYVDEFIWKHEGIPGQWDNRLKNQFEPVHHFALKEKVTLYHDDIKHASTRAGSYTGEDGTTSQGNVGFKGKVQSGLALPGNVVEVNHGEGRDDNSPHPAKFPPPLPAFFIRAFSKKLEIWYEPFAGSGTTLVACQNLNRKCYAIEISEHYCAVILERMATAFPELEIKRIDG